MYKIVLSLVLIGCSGDDPSDTSPVDTADTDAGAEPEEVDLTGLPQGTYLVNLSINSFGVVVPIQIDVVAAGTDDGSTVFETFDVRAVGSDDSVSDVLTSAPGPVPVTVDGGFTVALPEFVLPGEYSVTGGPVTTQLILSADSVSEEGFCGALDGRLVTFNSDLDGSTFGAVKWDDRTGDDPVSCDTGEIEEIPRITDCPDLIDGTNTAFPSGGHERSFEVVLPPDYDPAAKYPLVALFHGFGGTASDMVQSGILPYADDVILVSLQGELIGGTTGWDAFSDPRTNTDLVFFDDVVTCASASFGVDPERIHVTGMSNGGLMTGYLAATRPDLLASVAPMSGGVGIEPVPSDNRLPALVIWGGEIDLAFDQDFDLLAHEMIDLFLGNDQFVVGCDHGLGHTLSPDFWPWTMQFLLDHPRDLASEPYVDVLPSSFPDYCTIR